MEALGKLKPVFDKRYGTLTAGNSSPLTDGGSAVLLMSEEKAKALGYTPLGYIRSYAFTALNPGDQLLQGPAYAAPAALDAAGVKLADIDLVEMHEAFAAQILSNLKAFASKKFAERELGRERADGRDRPRPLQRHRRLDRHRPPLRRHRRAGGHCSSSTSCAAATSNLGLVTVCAAGGVGFAMVVERE